MDFKEKSKIVQTYAKKQLEESFIIKNGSIELPFGEDTIKLKELPWLEAEKFEKKVLEIVNSLVDSFGAEIDTENMMENVKNQGIQGFLDIVVTKILNKDLLDIVSILTRGKLTLEYIVEKEATKNQIIQIAIEGIKLNYSYLKNLISLAKNRLASALK